MGKIQAPSYTTKLKAPKGLKCYSDIIADDTFTKTLSTVVAGVCSVATAGEAKQPYRSPQKIALTSTAIALSLYPLSESESRWCTHAATEEAEAIFCGIW